MGPAAIALALSLAAADARAAADTYETRQVDESLKQSGREVEPSPDGKKIEEIVVMTEEIFTKADLWPSFLNVFHAKTRERIIRQEVLLAVGETWDTPRANETVRNLRNLFIFAVVAVLPVKGHDGGIGLLVVTKDRWSLRLNSEFNLVGSLLQYLRLRPTEENLFGNNQQLALDFILRLDTITVGEYFQERKLFGKNLYFGEVANLVFSRLTGLPEGTTGAAAFGRPLVSLNQTWALNLTGDWEVRRRRTYQGAHIVDLDYVDAEGKSAPVPWVWDVRSGTVEANGALRFGTTWKLDLQATLGFYSRQNLAPTDQDLTEDQRVWLKANWLPRSEYATYLYTEANLYPAHYEVLRNVDTFELSEDFLTGPLFKIAARWGLPRPLSTDQFLDVGATAQYRTQLGGDLLTLSVGGQVRFPAGSTPKNETIAYELLNYSPPFWGGRLVTRLTGQFRWNDLNNRRTLLGGGNGLRGAAAEQDIGRHYLLANVEYRSKAFELKTIFVGLVFFWDAGAAFDDAPVLTHTIGMGLRILLPQFNIDTIRIDFGVVIGGPQPSADRIAASYGQITDYRPAQLTKPL